MDGQQSSESGGPFKGADPTVLSLPGSLFGPHKTPTSLHAQPFSHVFTCLRTGKRESQPEFIEDANEAHFRC